MYEILTKIASLFAPRRPITPKSGCKSNNFFYPNKMFERKKMIFFRTYFQFAGFKHYILGNIFKKK